MMMRADRLCTVLWLAVLHFSGTTQDVKSAVPKSAGVSCEIQTLRSDMSTRLVAVIRAKGAVAGTYVLSVRRRAGGEVTSQSGDFEIDSNSPAEIKKASIALEPGQAYDASLAVKWPSGTSSCSASVR
jgi:hypothetical protein